MKPCEASTAATSVAIAQTLVGMGPGDALQATHHGARGDCGKDLRRPIPALP